MQKKEIQGYNYYKLSSKNIDDSPFEDVVIINEENDKINFGFNLKYGLHITDRSCEPFRSYSFKNIRDLIIKINNK